MGIYIGKFKDIHNTEYTITIDAHMISSSEEEEITFGETPCVISSESDGIFSPIKSRSCTVDVVSKHWMFDLYSPTAKGVSVRVQKGLNTVFFGYLTPNSYSQSYTYIDNISLEAVDAVSVLKNFDYQPISGTPSYEALIKIVCNLLDNAGYSGMLYVANSMGGINNVSDTSSPPATISRLFLSEGNFYDDDDEHTPWKQYEVLEEILKFLGYSLVPYGDDVYLLDYRYIAKSQTTNYVSFEISTGLMGSFNVPLSNQLNIVESTYAAGEPTLSMDEVYNKIEISDNLYEIEEIAPDIFEDELHISINDEKNLSVNGSKWVKTTVKPRFLRPDEISTQITGYDYQTICRLKPSTNWKHHFYRMSSLGSNPEEVINQNGQNYYDGDIGSLYVNGNINKYINTHGCLIQHYAYMKKDANFIPTSLDWENLLTFFVANDKINTNGHIDGNTYHNLELPVLEYEIPEEVMYKPSSGTSWIVINGELFYQFNDHKYGDKEESTLNIVNTTSHYYTTAPVDKSSDVDAEPFTYTERIYTSSGNTYYPRWSFIHAYDEYLHILGEFGEGYKMWKMKLQIGDKYWNGSSWTTTESTFHLSYNNNPDGDATEFLPIYDWCHLVSNTTFRDKVGKDGYCIPIDSTDANAPTKGKMKLTIYTPSFFPKQLLDFFSALSGGQIDVSDYVDCSWTDITPVIYCKDFEVDYIYTDSNVWYNQHKSNEAESRDIVYTNIINDDYVNDFSNLELKINTQQKDKPVSRSYITSQNGYVNVIKHVNSQSFKEQEKNLIDMYYEHYNSPKRIYECNIHGLIQPYSVVYVASLGGKYIVDSQSFDLKQNNNTIKLIEY